MSDDTPFNETVNALNYKAAAEKTDESERLLTPAINRRRAWREKTPPDLTIELFDVKGKTATIYCKEMKCEIQTNDIKRGVSDLVQEWLDLREAYL